jgi:hypothetical protein
VSHRIVVPRGITAIFTEYATAPAGLVHVAIDVIGMVRVSSAANAGGPNGYGLVFTRVSTTRHGVMAMKVAGEPSDEAAFPETCSRIRPSFTPEVERPDAGCQYGGAGQF